MIYFSLNCEGNRTVWFALVAGWQWQALGEKHPQFAIPSDHSQSASSGGCVDGIALIGTTAGGKEESSFILAMNSGGGAKITAQSNLTT